MQRRTLLTSTLIAALGMAGLAARADQLVHDAALATGEAMLCPLADQRQAGAIKIGLSGQRGQGQAGCVLQRRR